jgi:general secretion pathway protein M
MNQLIQQFQQGWQRLAPREQQLLSIAAPVVAVAVLYFGVWQPFQQWRVQQANELKQALSQLHNMQAALPQLQQGGVRNVQGSLADVVAQAATAHQLKVSRMQPKDAQLQLTLEDAPFNKLLQWLHQLQQQQGVQIVQLEVSAADSPGMVRVRRVVLQ